MDLVWNICNPAHNESAHGVASFEVFDFDHLGIQIRQRRGSRRYESVLSYLQDPYALQDLRHQDKFPFLEVQAGSASSLVCRNSSRPATPFSRPIPDCL